MNAVTPAAEVAGVRIRGLRKHYGDTVALDGLDIDARPGEILGVAGPNGAGKSTMVKILAAETPQTAGDILVDGEPWSVDIGVHRVAVVHQEPQLFPNLTVGDNVIVGREGVSWLRRSLDERELAVMRDLGIDGLKDRLLENVPLAIQQRTEIARALVQDARVFLFDEPNSALTEEESNDLFRRMHALADAGRVVILVSHRLAELVQHTDRVVVILDGKAARSLQGEELTQEAIARELVVGTAAQKESEDERLARMGQGDTPTLELRGWSHVGDEFRDVHLHVRTGEVLAIVGVEGSGARELVRSIAGFEEGKGHIIIDGEVGDEAVRSHTSFVSADRAASLFSNYTVGDNIVSRLSKEISGGVGALRRGRMTRIATDIRESFRVKSSSINVPIRSLSGGNQQKVAIAAAILKRPKALVLEEPTRGVDIGSKEEIYRLLRHFTSEGHAVILYCTEVPEIFDVADRVHVVSDGRLSDPLLVFEYPDVKALAAAITRLERHGASPAA
jgi:ABC-type sugar transport system ATPase subunit